MHRLRVVLVDRVQRRENDPVGFDTPGLAFIDFVLHFFVNAPWLAPAVPRIFVLLAGLRILAFFSAYVLDEFFHTTCFSFIIFVFLHIILGLVHGRCHAIPNVDLVKPIQVLRHLDEPFFSQVASFLGEQLPPRLEFVIPNDRGLLIINIVLRELALDDLVSLFQQVLQAIKTAFGLRLVLFQVIQNILSVRHLPGGPNLLQYRQRKPTPQLFQCLARHFPAL
mmetsp:Transcript_50431/g.128428  ORF Transcript_50431/g.128428 Transcript_50431/m.128428 type:complete len:223 (+) Transcript_50431:610-1278(+)